MRSRQAGMTALELVVVLAVISIVLTFMVPFIAEPIRNAKINGAIKQAREIVSACHLVRVTPISSSRNATSLKVTNTYGPDYPNWTNATVLTNKLSSGYRLETVNPFDRPYYFKMNSQTCSAAVELDELIEEWEGHEIETVGTRSRIIVSVPARSPTGPAWVQHQKRLLFGEEIR